MGGSKCQFVSKRIDPVSKFIDDFEMVRILEPPVPIFLTSPFSVPTTGPNGVFIYY